MLFSAVLMGILVIMDDKHLENIQLLTSVLEIFASWAGAELGRRNAEAALRNGMVTVLHLFIELAHGKLSHGVSLKS